MANRQHTIGLDISDRSINILELDVSGAVVIYGRTLLTSGIVKDGVIADKERFKAELSQALAKTAPVSLTGERIQAYACVPGSKLLTYYFEVPDDIPDADVASYITKQASSMIPFPFSDLCSDYILIEGDSRKEVLFAAAQKELVADYIDLYHACGIEVVLMGGELFSLGRALLSTVPKDTTLIVDFGTRATDIGVFDRDGIVRMSLSIPFGGEKITDILAKELKLAPEEAEEKKMQQGLAKRKSKSGVSYIIRQAMRELTDELRETVDYFVKQKTIPITHILLTGGTAMLPGVAEYIEECVGIKTTIGDPFKAINADQLRNAGVPPIAFANVIGLALRGLLHDTPGVDLRECKFALPESKESPKTIDAKISHLIVKGTYTKSQLVLGVFFMAAACALLIFALINFL